MSATISISSPQRCRRESAAQPGPSPRSGLPTCGERVGKGNPPGVDVAVDPIDGTRLVARGLPGGIATVALAERGSMFHTHIAYMEKLIVGPEAAKVIDITDGVAANLRRIARAED